MLRLTLFSAALCSFVVAPAQDTKTPVKKERSYFKAEVSYLSDAVYNGRRDSVAVPYLTPKIGYYDKSGFSLSTSLSYSAGSPGRIDLFSLDAGYDFSIAKNLDGSIYGSKAFYNKNSTSVKSQVKGSAGLSITYDPDFLTISGGADIDFSQQNDLIINYAVSHAFHFGEDSSGWTIEPTVRSNLGTQKSYAAQRKAKKAASGSAVTVSGSSAFVVLDYEFAVPISYEAKKWGISFTPTLAIPKNPISTTRPNGTVFYEENLSNVFYAEAGVYFKF
jgi:hypothetical protein